MEDTVTLISQRIICWVGDFDTQNFDKNLREKLCFKIL